jgi:hypothetical protein
MTGGDTLATVLDTVDTAAAEFPFLNKTLWKDIGMRKIVDGTRTLPHLGRRYDLLADGVVEQ